MRINSIDHVNIVTDDVKATARFYADIFGLEPRSPGDLEPSMATWIYDSNGHPILHIVSPRMRTPGARRTDGTAVRGGPTGSIDHVALNCTGYEEIEKRMKEHGLEYRSNEIPRMSLRQLFTLDPNGVLLEFNFYAEAETVPGEASDEEVQ